MTGVCYIENISPVPLPCNSGYEPQSVLSRLKKFEFFFFGRRQGPDYLEIVTHAYLCYVYHSRYRSMLAQVEQLTLCAHTYIQVP